MTQSSLHSPKIQHLPNGLTIIAESIPTEAVNLNLWLNVGSSLETDEINGMAHFLEHMIFKGTEKLPKGEFERLVEGRGAVTNAATSQEYTHYYITSAPADFTDLAPWQLDVVLNASIPEEEFQKERLVVLEEIRRSEDNPSRRLFSRVMEISFANLPYRRPVLGPTSVIENLKSEQMRDFHQTWYQPHSMTAVVVGNLPEEKLIETVQQNLQLGENKTFTQVRQEYQPEPPFTEIVRSDTIDEGLQQARLVIMWRVPGLSDLAQSNALDVLAAILGQGKTSRLFRRLREEERLVTQISASNLTQFVQGAFYISAQLASSDNLEKVEKAIIEEIVKIQQEGVIESELIRISTQVTNRYIFNSEKPSDRANLYGYYYSQMKDLTPALNYPSLIQSLSREDIRQVACAHLSASAYGIVIMRPSQSN